MLWYFYPRSPCGERLQPTTIPASRARISIHALLAESDNQAIRDDVVHLLISIHALLAESDIRSLKSSFHDYDFYPRSPCGERPKELPKP